MRHVGPMHQRVWPRLAALLAMAASRNALLVLLAVASGSLLANAASAADEESQLRFRRVYATTENLDDAVRASATSRPGAGSRYVPVDPAEFESLLEAASNHPAQTNVQPVARVASSVYRAALDGGGQLVGTGALDVEHLSDATVLLRLEPLNLAVRDPRWASAASDAPEGRSAAEATVGAVGDRFVALVPKSGTLEFDWQAAGQKSADGRTRFDLRFPACPAIRLELDLPETLAPTVNHGLLSQVDGAPVDQQRWLVEAGGWNELSIVLASSLAASRQGRVSYIEDATYVVTPLGVDVTYEWRIDTLAQSLARLELLLDPQLELHGIQYEDQSAHWSAAEAGENGEQRVIVQFAQPLSGTDRVVRLSARAPLVTGRLWDLPRISAPEMFWREGTLAVSLHEPIDLVRLEPRESRQTAAGLLPAPLRGRSFAFQSFAPESQIGLWLEYQAATFRVSVATRVGLTSHDLINSECIVSLASDGNVPARLTATLAAGWTIDSVTAEPPTILEDWSVETKADGQPELTLDLAEPQRDVAARQITVRGRRAPLASGESYAMDDLCWLTPDDVEVLSSLLGLYTPAGEGLVWPDGGTVGTEANQLAAGAAENLFADLPCDVVLSCDALEPQWRVSVAANASQFRAAVTTHADLAPSGLHEQIKIRIHPDAQPISHVLVRLNGAPSFSPKWSIHNPSSVRITASQVKRGDRSGPQRDSDQTSHSPAAAADLPNATDSDGQLWRVDFSPSLRTTAELECALDTLGTSAILQAAELEVILPAVVGATEQDAVVLLAAAADVSVSLRERGLRAVAPPHVPEGEVSLVRSAYKYNTDDPETSLVAVVGHGLAQRGWFWQVATDTLVHEDGRMLHRSSGLLESAGLDQLWVQLPGDAANVEFQLDGHPTASQQQGAEYQLALPTGRRFVTVEVEFSQERAEKGVAPPTVGWSGLPVLSESWRIHVPPSFDVSSGRESGEQAEATALGIAQRLAGPLGRSPGASPFDPLMVGSVAARDATGVAASRDAARNLLEQLAELERQPPRDSGGGLTWGKWLATAAQRARSSGSSLVVDRAALAARGISPSTLVELPASSQASADAQTASADSPLIPRELILLVAPDRLVLTSTDALAALGIRPDPGESDTVVALSGASASQFQATAEPLRFVPVDFWSRSVLDDSGWQGVSRANQVVPQGWRTFEIEDVGGAFVRIVRPAHTAVPIVRRSTLVAAAWCCFTLAALAGVLIVRRSGRALLAVLAVAVVVALLAPATLAPLASWSALGLALAGLLAAAHAALVRSAKGGSTIVRAVQGSPTWVAVFLAACVLLLDADSTVTWAVQPEPNETEPSSQEPAGQRTVAERLIEAIEAIAEQARSSGLKAGDEATMRESAPERANDQATGARTAERANGQTAAYRVLIPVDNENRPTGGSYQVPEEFYARLRRLAAAAAGEPQEPLLRSAKYAVRVDWDRLAGTPRSASLETRYEVQSFLPDARFELPGIVQSATQFGESVTVDGQRVERERSNGNGAQTATLAEPGLHRVRIDANPRLETRRDERRLELQLPRLATSELTLAQPLSAPRPTIETEQGTVEWTVRAGQLVAQLGPVARATLAWARAGSAAVREPAIDAQELSWLTIRPGAVDLRLLLRLRISQVPLERFSIEAPPGYRLVPSPAERLVVADVRRVPEHPERIEVELNEPALGLVEVPLTLSLTGRTGVGRYGIPAVRVLDATTRQQSFAVSIAPEMDYTADGAVQLEVVPPKEFAAAWQSAEVPTLAYRIPIEDSDWTITTRPREPIERVEQNTVLGVQPGRVLVRYLAQFSPPSEAGSQPATIFRHTLRAPAELRIEQVTLSQAMQAALTSVKQSKDGHILVLADRPVTGPHSLELTGWIPAPREGELPLPIITVDEGIETALVVEVYRDPSIEVTLAATGGVTEGRPGRWQPPASWGRLVGAYSVQSDTPEARLAIADNRRELEEHVFCALEPDDAGWSAVLDYRCSLRGGALDEVRFDLPDDSSGPFTLTPAMPFEIVAATGSEPRKLVVRPQSPLAREVQLRIRSAIQVEPGIALTLPWMTPQNGAATTHYYAALPMQAGLDVMRWDVRSLRPTRQTYAARGSSLASSYFATYELVRPTATVTLDEVRRATQALRVREAEVHVRWSPEGQAAGVASFQIEPAANRECQITIPENCMLLETRVGGRLVTPTVVDGGIWAVDLGVPQELVPLEMVFASVLNPATRSEVELVAPFVSGATVEQTSWHVYSPLGQGVGQVLSGDAVASLPGEPAPPKAEPTLASVTAEATLATSGESLVVRQAGQLDTLRVAYPAAARGDFWARLLAAASVLVVAGALIFGGLGAHIREALLRWPQACGVLAGVAWWLWLEPSAVGWLIIAASLLSAAREAWGWHSVAVQSSTNG